MATQQQVDNFHAFATQQLDQVGPEFSIDELYSLWRAKHPSETELAHSVAALREAAADMAAGDTGRPARQALRETCNRLGLVIDE